jgi:hypothetical protein
MATSALDQIRGVLNDYGLGGLADAYWQKILDNTPESEIFLWLRSTNEYKQRFPAMAQRAAANLPAISEEEYISYETAARQIMRSAGLPQGFYDQPADFANFIGKDVSIREFNQRVDDGIIAAAKAPQDVRDQLQSLYGVTEGGLAAFFLDPDRALPVLQRDFQAAQTAAASQRTGFGQLTRDQAERIAATGVTADEAQNRFGQLAQVGEVVKALPGERQDTEISQETQIAAGFEGSTAAQQAIENKRAGRKAQFEGGGGVLTSEKGLIGAGQATT